MLTCSFILLKWTSLLWLLTHSKAPLAFRLQLSEEIKPTPSVLHILAYNGILIFFLSFFNTDTDGTVVILKQKYLHVFKVFSRKMTSLKAAVFKSKCRSFLRPNFMSRKICSVIINRIYFLSVNTVPSSPPDILVCLRVITIFFRWKFKAGQRSGIRSVFDKCGQGVLKKYVYTVSSLLFLPLLKFLFCSVYINFIFVELWTWSLWFLWIRIQWQ